MIASLNPFFLIFVSYGAGVLGTEMLKLFGIYRFFEGRNYLDDSLTRKLGVLYLGWIIRHSFLGKFNQKLKYTGAFRKKSLKKLYDDMTYAEVNHLMSYIVLQLFLVIMIFLGMKTGYFLVMSLLNIIFNFYLVLLQQFNKRRIHKLLGP